MAFQRHLASIRSGHRNHPVIGTFLVTVFAVALLTVACSSNSGETPVGTPSFTPEPTRDLQTPQATGFPADITIPGCDTRNGFSSGGLGTAPGPTPTPTQSVGQRTDETVREELAEYFGEAFGVVTYLNHWAITFPEDWSSSLSSGEQVEALQVFGIRLALGCDAVSRISYVPPEASEFDLAMRNALSRAHDRVVVAVDEIASTGDGISPSTDLSVHEGSSAVGDLLTVASELMSEQRVVLSEARRFADEAIGIEATLGEGWVVSADGLSPVLLGSSETNSTGITGLGPERWQLGTAVRVRRLRNSEPIDVQEASSRFGSLISQQGSVDMVEETTFGSTAALRHVLSPTLDNWGASVLVFVEGGFTYFIEAGCSLDVANSCEATESMAMAIEVAN